MAYTSNKFGYADNTGNLDAFARLRVSDPQTIFDSKQVADKGPQFWDDQQTSGAGTSSTYSANRASTIIAVGAATAGTRVRQTFRSFNYQPGKSQLFIETGVWGAAATGITRRSGQFNGTNGLFFEQTSQGIFIVIRSFVTGVAVDTKVHQNNPALSTDGVSTWNIDRLDGSAGIYNLSKINLDFSKALIWFCDYEWLGVGRVRYGFFVNGLPYYCHEVLNANNITSVYMSTPNLPLRYEISNDGTGAAAGFEHICSTVISEGGHEDTGYPYGVSRGVTAMTTGNDTQIYPLIAMRLRSGYIGSAIKILDFSISCTSTAAFNYYLLLNPVVAGTAFSFTAVGNSSIEADTARTNTTTLTGGTILKVGTTQQTNDSDLSSILNSDFALGTTIAGVTDILVLAVQRITGTSETFYGSINWKDQQ